MPPGAGPNATGGDLGSLSGPMGFGQVNSNAGIFVESAFSIGSPSVATKILRRLAYTPPTPANGTYATADAAINIGSAALPWLTAARRSPPIRTTR